MRCVTKPRLSKRAYIISKPPMRCVTFFLALNQNHFFSKPPMRCVTKPRLSKRAYIISKPPMRCVTSEGAKDDKNEFSKPPMRCVTATFQYVINCSYF